MSDFARMWYHIAVVYGWQNWPQTALAVMGEEFRNLCVGAAPRGLTKGKR